MKNINKEFSDIKSLDESKVKALMDAGFESIGDLINASIEDLANVEGVDAKLAEIIKAEAMELSSENVEKPEKPATSKSIESVETVRLAMDEESRRLFNVRKVQKAKKPDFKRADSHKKKRLDSNWRRPRGLQGKQRKHIKAKGALAQVGYGSPVAVKGLHPSGYADILVNNLSDVEKIDASIEAIRIARTIGARKKVIIEEKAAELGLKVLNPTRGE